MLDGIMYISCILSNIFIGLICFSVVLIKYLGNHLNVYNS